MVGVEGARTRAFSFFFFFFFPQGRALRGGGKERAPLFITMNESPTVSGCDDSCISCEMQKKISIYLECDIINEF